MGGRAEIRRHLMITNSSPPAVHCPCCGATAVRLLRDPVLVCSMCGHRFMAAPPIVIYDEAYHGFSDDPYFRAKVRLEIRERIGPMLPAGARVLDVGCGNGVFVEEAEKAGYPALGIDTSQAAVKLCLSRGLEARCCTLHEVTDHFDVVTMWDVIEHVVDPAALISDAHRVLRPDGILVVKTPYAARGVFHLRPLWPLLLQMPAHVQFFTTSSLSVLLTRSGFSPTVIRAERFRGRKKVSSPRSMGGRVLRDLAWWTNLTGNLYALARRQLAPPA